MASAVALEKQKQQLKSLEISDTEEIFLPLGGNIIAIAVSMPLNKNKNGSHKYGLIATLGVIVTVLMLDTGELKNMRTKLTFHLWKLRRMKASLSQEVVSWIFQKQQR